jgi:hypothetical protein
MMPAMRRCVLALSVLAASLAACSDPPAAGSPDGALPGPPDAAMAPADAPPPPDAAPPDADPSLPNLRLMESRIAPTVFLDEMNFTPSSCAVAEGCAYPGFRRMLRFDTVTENAGGSDMFVGEPGTFGGLENWEWSNCHGHYHFRAYATYELVDLAGNVVMSQDGPAVSRKQAFCLEDTDRIRSDAKPEQSRFCGPGDQPNSNCIYNCGYQGISAGWADTYSSMLTCQWIDVCGVPEGDYHLRIRVNPKRILPEGRYDDNELLVPVHIDAPPATPGLCQ